MGAETIKIDKSKMTPEELASFNEFEKKFGVAEPEGTPEFTTGATIAAKENGITKGASVATSADTSIAELHPEVKKALADNATLAAQVEELKKSLEIKDLVTVAKKYEIIGKKPEELANTLYELKKAGGNHYQTTITLLDEQVTLVEKSGLFGEFGRNTSGGISAKDELEVKAAEIKKSNTGMSDAEAFSKAYETYPDLAAQYEQTYRGRA